MSVQIRIIDTPGEREKIYAFRYHVFVEQLGMQPDVDHERKWPAAAIAIATFAVLAGSAVAFFDDEKINTVAPVRTSDIGTSIFERFVVPFEVVSFVLLAALIGGIVLARKDPEA